MARTPSRDVADVLLNAADEILRAEGPAALTVRRVATAAGVAPMGVYNRFEGKQGLLEALFIRGFTMLRTEIAEAEGPDALHRLISAADRYREFALGHAEHYRLMFEHMAEVQPGPEALEIAYAAFDQLVGLIADARSQGGFGIGDDVDVAQQWWNALHGAVSLELLGVSFVADPTASYRQMVQSLAAGMRRVADPPPA